MTFEAQRAVRNKKLRRALGTSVVARSAGILLQVVSLPIAAAALGPEGFSVYSMIGAILAWMTLSNLGIGQATTLHMSKALGEGREIQSLVILYASWVVLVLLTLVALLVVICLMLFTPLVDEVFKTHASDMAPVYGALIFACIVFFITQNLSIFESAQLAHQRQDLYNIATAVGTTLAAGAVFLTAQHGASVLAILSAVHLPVLAMRVANAIIVWRMIRPGLQSNLAVTGSDFRRVVQDGVSFVSGSAVSNFLCHPLSILTVGIYADSLVAASFSALMGAVILASAVFGLVMAPFRGALPEASVRGDASWIRRMYTTTLCGNFVYALFPCILFAVFGESLFSVWYQGSVQPSRDLLIPAGLYMLCQAIDVTNYNFLANLGKVKTASRWMLGKSVVTAVVVWSLAAEGRPDLSLWGVVVGNIVLSLCPLGLMCGRLLRCGKGLSNA